MARHTAPRLRGGTATRFVALFTGLFVFAIGIVCLYESKLGLSPWDVLNQGVAKHTPLSFGEANICVGVTVLVLGLLLGARIGFGTVSNAVFVGTFVDQLLRIDWVTDRAHDPVAVRIVLIAIGIVLMGIATALYVGASFGAGPRDSLMLVLSLRTHARIGLVRGVLEAVPLVVGFLLGGKVGIGTLVYVVAIGPVVEASFALFDRSPVTL
ncbi:MAG TPA: hypothetical protein VGU02_10310 [Gaiellaceae bacterium]|nr:hypothetical protein [Gaiellaceae bacterium]